MISSLALIPLSIPSPPVNEWHIFGLPIRAYALCIMAGIVVALIISSRRWRAIGGNSETLETGALLAVPCGIIGARLYHVITDYELYFGPGRHPINAFKIWDGGLGIWGGVALGALGMFIVVRHRRASFPAIADACAPGILIAQGIGRIGNYFNQELFGRPTTLPWALQIAPEHRPIGFEQYATFHPTFLYELIWDIGMALVLLAVDRRFRLGRGKLFVLYVVLYTLGRFWIEALRIDHANHIGGFRLNDYTSGIVFVLALAFFVYLCFVRPGANHDVDPTAVQPEGAGDQAVTDGGPTEQEAPSEQEDATEQTGGVGDESAADSAPATSEDRSRPTTGPDEDHQPEPAGAHSPSSPTRDD